MRFWNRSNDDRRHACSMSMVVAFINYTHCLCLIWCLEKSEQDFCWGICRLVIAAISVVMKGTTDIKLYLSAYPFWRERERLFHLRVWDKRVRRQEQNIMAHMWAASAGATLKKKKNILHQSIMTTKSCAVINKVTLERYGLSLPWSMLWLFVINSPSVFSKTTQKWILIK